MVMNRVKKLHVSSPQGHSGALIKESKFVFNSEPQGEFATASLALPIQSTTYKSGRLFSTFQMNRPEGFLLNFLKYKFSKTSNFDDMMLLKLIGANQIGRLTYTDPEDSIVSKPNPQVSMSEILSSSDSKELFEFLVDAHFNSGISGFQPKVIVQTTDNAALIVKSAGDDYPFLAQNEFLCMEVARRAGIEVPNFWLSDDGGLFVIERFDRSAGGIKYGLEDMTALMGKTSEEKYQGSYESVAKVIDLYCGKNAPESKAKFFEYVALSALLRNGDAHLKNFSLIYDTPGGDVKLSPLYDVVTTAIYEIEDPQTGATKVDNTMALKMFKKKGFPSELALTKFGKSICMVENPEQIIEKIQEMKIEVMREYSVRMDDRLIKKIKVAWSLRD